MTPPPLTTLSNAPSGAGAKTAHIFIIIIACTIIHSSAMQPCVFFAAADVDSDSTTQSGVVQVGSGSGLALAPAAAVMLALVLFDFQY